MHWFKESCFIEWQVLHCVLIEGTYRISFPGVF